MFLALLLFWFIFNGRFTIEILLVGVVVSAALTRLWKSVFGASRNTLLPLPEMMWRYTKYFGSLVLEIISCSLQVMRLVLHPEEEVRPQLVTFRTGLKKDSHKTILANSITLTPGTVTVGVRDDILRIHALDAAFAEGIEDCDMVRRLMKMEEGKRA